MVALLVILALVLVNGLLAGAEIAIVSVRRTRLDELASKGSAAARAVRRLRADPETFLATVQVGSTVVGSTAAAFGATEFARDLEPAVRRISILAAYAPQIAVVTVVVGIAYLTVVLGELVPKSLALRTSERYALLAGPPLLAISRAARPIVWFLAASSNVVLRLFGDRTTFMESRLSPQEVRRLVDDAAKSGAVDASAGAIASRALGFAALLAEDVMVHRRFVFCLDAATSLRDAQALLAKSGYDRAPVIEGTDGDVIGYATWHDLTPLGPDAAATPLRSVVRTALYVPESMQAIDLLREMQRRRVRLGVVVDERGGSVGIVTLTDLVEEMVGEVLGETEPQAAARIRRQPDGSILVDGIVPIPFVNRELDVRVPDDGSAATIGGLLSRLVGGRIPEPGERVELPDGTVMEAVEVSARRVRLVRIRPSGDGANSARRR